MITEEKKEEIRAILKQVNVAKICEDRGLRRSAVWEALSGKKTNTEVLEIVVKVARREIKKRQKNLQQL